MARRKFILVAGADNAADLADPQLFEAAMPFLALRDPTRDLNRAASAEVFELPDRFFGGPPKLHDGTVSLGIDYQSADLQGSAVSGMRFLVRHNHPSVKPDEEQNFGLNYIYVDYLITALLPQGRFLMEPPFPLPDPPAVRTEVTGCNAFGVFSIAADLVLGQRVVFESIGALPPSNIIDFGAVYSVLFVDTPGSEYSFALNSDPTVQIVPTAFGAGLVAVYPVAQEVAFLRPLYAPFELIAAPHDTDGSMHALDFTSGPPFLNVGEILRLEVPVSGDPTAYPPLSRLVASEGMPGSVVVPGAVSMANVLQMMGTGDAVMRIDGAPAMEYQAVKITAAVAGTLPPELVEGEIYYLTTRLPDTASGELFRGVSNSMRSDGEPHGFLLGERLVFDEPRPILVSAGFPELVTAFAGAPISTPSLNLRYVAVPGSTTPLSIASDSTLYPRSDRGGLCYYLSATPGGAPIVIAGTIDAGLSLEVELLSVQRGSLAGFRVRFLDGTAHGEIRDAGNVDVDAMGRQGLRFDPLLDPALTFDSVAFDSPISAGAPVDPHKWGLFLPWSPFEGRSDLGGVQPCELKVPNPAPGAVTLRLLDALSIPGSTSPLASPFTVDGPVDAPARGYFVGRSVMFFDSERVRPEPMGNANTLTGELRGATGSNTVGLWLDVGDRVRFMPDADADGVLPVGLTEGVSYYVREVSDNNAIKVSLTATSAIIVPSTIGSVWYSQACNPRNLPGGIRAGERLFIRTIDADGLMTLARERWGDPIESMPDEGATHVCYLHVSIADQFDRVNPYPPGFDHPSSQVLPTGRELFDSYSPDSRAKVGFAVPLAYHFAMHLGEPVYVVQAAFPDSSVGPRELSDVDLGEPVAWFDPARAVSWSPGMDSCFALLEETLDVAVQAFRAQGDTGDCIGVFWAGGDVDAEHPELVEMFPTSFVTLRDRIRQALGERKLVAGEPGHVPFVVIGLAEDGAAGRVAVNAAFRDTADRWSRVVPVSGLVDVATGAGLEPADGSWPVEPLSE